MIFTYHHLSSIIVINLKKCAEAQSSPIIFSEDIMLIDTDADRNHNKNHFFQSGGLKKSKFHKKLKTHSSHKTNTFSYDDNVKIYCK